MIFLGLLLCATSLGFFYCTLCVLHSIEILKAFPSIFGDVRHYLHIDLPNFSCARSFISSFSTTLYAR